MEYFFWRFGDLKNESHFLKKATFNNRLSIFSSVLVSETPNAPPAPSLTTALPRLFQVSENLRLTLYLTFFRGFYVTLILRQYKKLSQFCWGIFSLICSKINQILAHRKFVRNNVGSTKIGHNFRK